MIRLHQVRVDINNKKELIEIIASKLKVSKNRIKKYVIHKKSIDARNKILFSYVYDFDIELSAENTFLKKCKLKNITIVENEEYILPKMGVEKLKKSPVIIGMGPAGLFAAYYLAKNGFKPIVFERGEKVEDRIKTIEKFWNENVLNLNSNVHFGEGGAGTFSDGKLNTLVKDKNNRMQEVFKVFVECGAPEEIMYDNKPHIGTDILRKVIINMRNKIIEYGGIINYNSKMEDILIEDKKVTGIIVNGKKYLTEVLILAIGHSAHDTFEKLLTLGMQLEAKPLAIGIRIMHPQEMTNNTQYPINYPFLPAASYKLTYNTKKNRGVYSFCMCPGGYVVNASSDFKKVVINGMSNYKRDSGTANSAIIVTISPKDFGTKPLDGMYFLENIENKAYKLTDGLIAIQKYGDYKKKIISQNIDNNIAIKGKYKSVNVNDIFPSYINESLKEGIDYFGTKIKNFNGDNVLILAPETRTSSPIRIVRNEDCESNIRGIYPCGEGSGYAGGITTSAMDGLKVFESIMTKYHN